MRDAWDVGWRRMGSYVMPIDAPLEDATIEKCRATPGPKWSTTLPWVRFVPGGGAQTAGRLRHRRPSRELLRPLRTGVSGGASSS